ncbi:hypothetical protein NC652_023159 [Populus alba x Populus x berolinensis]|nr:hypothetical protein NC652_023159 [Populus alba x Populus x berolinensis]
MNDWQQCPELGPIGDVLSGSDSSHTTSVLIIQQHSLKGELDACEEKLAIMEHVVVVAYGQWLLLLLVKASVAVGGGCSRSGSGMILIGEGEDA